ncbi:MAG: leucine-rich repeat domain-containing protein [Alphaproteobacteria bacterium]|nr:leucine-rich repeat domain-containing protein [Alphaproteobacteria bacterium]
MTYSIKKILTILPSNSNNGGRIVKKTFKAMSAAICILTLLSTTSSYVIADFIDDAIAEFKAEKQGNIDINDKGIKSFKELDLTKVPEFVWQLDLRDNSISSLDSIDCPQIVSLILINNKLKSLKGKNINLPKLKELRVDNNQLRSLEGLENFPHLTHLSIGNFSLYSNNGDNRLKSLKGIEILEDLEDLDVRDVQLKSLDGLEKLSKLKKLILNSNKDITKETLDQLSKQLPDCHIYKYDSDQQKLELFKNGERKYVGRAIGSTPIRP